MDWRRITRSDDEGREGEVGIGMKDVHALGGRVK